MFLSILFTKRKNNTLIVSLTTFKSLIQKKCRKCENLTRTLKYLPCSEAAVLELTHDNIIIIIIYRTFIALMLEFRALYSYMNKKDKLKFTTLTKY